MRTAARGSRTALVVAVLVLAACSSKKSGAGTVSTLKLKAGDCLVPPQAVAVQLAEVQQVPCADSHTQEVFALPTYAPEGGTSDSTYAGDQVLKAYAEGSCAEQFQSYVGVAYPDSSLFFTYLLPSPRSWSAGDRTVVCVVQSTGAPLKGSVRGSKR